MQNRSEVGVAPHVNYLWKWLAIKRVYCLLLMFQKQSSQSQFLSTICNTRFYALCVPCPCCGFEKSFETWSGPGSSVGIATDYELDDPGSNAGGDEIFRPSRPAVGPTQPPVQWGPGLSRG